MSKKVPIAEQLFWAGHTGNVAELHRLIDGGADVNATYYVSEYVLCMCSRETREYDECRDTVTDCA
jgi:hypothetical protein